MGEWTDFPEAYFALATYQLVLRDDKAYIGIHLIANAAEADGQLEALRKERNHLIHAAQVKEVKMYAKPEITNYFEPYKDPYLASIDQVTALIKAKKADKVVIARSLALQFKEQVTSPQVLAQIIHEQPESYLFGLEWQDLLFFGASPERLVKVENGRAYSSCVAGSIQRGKRRRKMKPMDKAY